MPSTPHGPSTFVGDALYLRDNLLLDGGDQIISKYSRRAPETTVTRKFPKKVKRARTVEQAASQKALSPKLSPAKLLQDQGGIEGMIHEAARGVYNRGEKWGVTKALRGAMQGLQSGNSSPRRYSHRSRSSLDSDKTVPEGPAQMIEKVQALEQRNQSLSKLLEAAVGELWAQQKEIHQKQDEAAADALSLAIAKVQFVQVYLENSTMPLPSEGTTLKAAGSEKATDTLVERVGLKLSRDEFSSDPTLVDGLAEDKNVKERSRDGSSGSSVQNSSAVLDRPSPSTPKANDLFKASGPRRLSQNRPALAQSPFSWMLGEEEQKSSFVSASAFSSERPGGRSKSGSLFGDEKMDDGKGRSGPKVKGRGDTTEDGDDVFTLGSLKGGMKR